MRNATHRSGLVKNSMPSRLAFWLCATHSIGRAEQYVFPLPVEDSGRFLHTTSAVTADTARGTFSGTYLRRIQAPAKRAGAASQGNAHRALPNTFVMRKLVIWTPAGVR